MRFLMPVSDCESTLPQQNDSIVDLTWRKRLGAHKLLEDCNDLRVAGNFSDHPLVRVRHERRGDPDPISFSLASAKS